GDLDLPGRWVDWENRIPAPSWISIVWRAEDDQLHTGARAVLEHLLNGVHTELYAGAEVNWPSWRTFAGTFGGQQLTMAGLRPDLWAIGHSTESGAAVIQQDGRIIADRAGSPSLAVLRGWLTDWEKAGRPAPEDFAPSLVRHDDSRDRAGWTLRLSL
ncbi:protein-L-isoaspartate(D-aspartate) O-methyltransferase, partial [Streptomyces sp. NPDC097640]